MVLRSLGIALCGVEIRPLNLGGEGLKIGINDERDRQLLVVVLKEDLVFTLFRHLHSHGCLAYPTTVGSVGFQQILPCVAVQAALAEVLALLVLALVTEKAVEVFDPCVVKFAGLFNLQQIYAGHFIWLSAEPVNSHALIPTKYVNGQVIQLLHSWDLKDGRGGIERSDHLRWGTILVSQGDVVAVDMPEPPEAPIEDRVKNTAGERRGCKTKHCWGLSVAIEKWSRTPTLSKLTHMIISCRAALIEKWCRHDYFLRRPKAGRLRP